MISISVAIGAPRDAVHLLARGDVLSDHDSASAGPPIGREIVLDSNRLLGLVVDANNSPFLIIHI